MPWPLAPEPFISDAATPYKLNGYSRVALAEGSPQAVQRPWSLGSHLRSWSSTRSSASRAEEIPGALRGLGGASPPVARSQLAVLIRGVGCEEAANVASKRRT
jgi:hypothetical protein